MARSSFHLAGLTPMVRPPWIPPPSEDLNDLIFDLGMRLTQPYHDSLGADPDVVRRLLINYWLDISFRISANGWSDAVTRALAPMGRRGVMSANHWFCGRWDDDIDTMTSMAWHLGATGFCVAAIRAMHVIAAAADEEDSRRGMHLHAR